jgi:hypothetical protein
VREYGNPKRPANFDSSSVCCVKRMKQRREEMAYCHRQATRCRRLARDLMYQHRDVATALETLAQEFEERAALLEAQGGAPGHKEPR